MKLVVAAVRPTPILWWRASGLESPTEVPASTLPARGIAPVRAIISSRSVVLPLWKGPTSAMHRGPRGLLTSSPIAASSSGARPLIGSAALMLRPSRRFGKRENVAAVHRGVHTAVIPGMNAIAFTRGALGGAIAPLACAPRRMGHLH